MSIETKINGNLIGYASVENKGEVFKKEILYSVEYHFIGREPNVSEFNIYIILKKVLKN